MADTIDVEIPVDAAVVGRLEDATTRRIVGRVVSRMLEPSGVDEFEALLRRIATEARARGLTDAILEEELAAYNAERRDAEPPTAT